MVEIAMAIAVDKVSTTAAAVAILVPVQADLAQSVRAAAVHRPVHHVSTVEIPLVQIVTIAVEATTNDLVRTALVLPM